MPPTSVKDEARRLVDQLPDDATWDDLLYQIHVRRSADDGRLASTTAADHRPVSPIEPRDEWERRLLAIGTDCGVSPPDEALSREDMYD
jgi:hypothetical protein